ncbi:MAG: hypothetical protein AAF515_07695 [Pseudomonadota bacterium]
MSEVVTAILFVVIVTAVGFGIYVNGERNDMVDQAKQSIAAITERVQAVKESGEDIACTNALVDEALLANRFLSLAIKAVPVDEADPASAMTAGLRIRGNEEIDGRDAYATANLLFEALKDDDQANLRKIKKDEDARSMNFSVMLFKDAVCAA